MHDSVDPAQGNDERLVIYQSTDREGSTFSLSPETKRTLQRRFGDRLRVAPRIFIAHPVHSDLEHLHGSLSKRLVALLTGFDDDLLAEAGDFEFRDPVTDRQL